MNLSSLGHQMAKNIKLNLLGVIKLEFNASGYPLWAIICVGIVLAAINVTLISLLGFWAIGQLFGIQIPFTFMNVLAAIVLFAMVHGTD